MSPEAEQFFRCHDTAHVVFGCNTSIFGEGVVKLFTVWGTSLGFFKHISGYSEADAFSLFRMYSFGHVIRNVWRVFVVIPKVFIRSKQMTKPWPWSDHEQYLDVPLKEIREEFGIKVIGM